MDLAIQLSSNDKILREESMRELREYKTNSILTKSRRGEEIEAMFPAFEKRLSILGEEMIEVVTEKMY